MIRSLAATVVTAGGVFVLSAAAAGVWDSWQTSRTPLDRIVVAVCGSLILGGIVGLWALIMRALIS